MRDSKWQKVDKICYFKWHVLDGFGFGFEITIIQTPQNKKKLAKKNQGIWREKNHHKAWEVKTTVAYLCLLE